MNVNFKGYKKKDRKVYPRDNCRPGMGIRLHMSSADPFRYPRIKSAKRFIKLTDSARCLTILYKTFGYTAYGAKRVECIFRDEKTLLERYGDRLCWK